MRRLLVLAISYSLCTMNVSGQTINTIAGTGNGQFNGDNIPATTANIITNGLAVDGAGNVYFVDHGNNMVRKINTAGIITTIAGTGVAGYSGDGGPATAAQLYYPSAVAVDNAGNVFVADYSNSRIRKINSAGIITTVAGTGVAGYSGDGGPATSAEIKYPAGIALNAAGELIISDYSNSVIRKIHTSGVITTIAGNGSAGFSGDGGSAIAASLKYPRGVAVDAAGNVYIADYYNGRVRKVNTSGIISTVAGIGFQGYSGDGGSATAAKLNWPNGIAVDAAGNLYIADESNGRIRKVNSAGIISTLAGTGIIGYNGDGGAATAARLNYPTDVDFDLAGNIYISDDANNRIRKVGNYVLPAVSISTAQNSVCANTSVTFTATITNGGTAPAYQWKVNGNNVGTNSPTYNTTPANGAIISCTLTSNDPNANPAIVSSNSISMTVNPVVVPTVNIAANPGTTVSTGQQIMFTVNATNAGTNPQYQWRKNGVNITGATQASYVAVAGTGIQNNDKISVCVKNTQTCGDTAVSNALTIAIATGISNVSGYNSALALYPNPNHGSFTLKGSLPDNQKHTVTIEVYNTIGQNVYKEELPVANGTLDHTIELPKGLPYGGYFLKLNDGGSSIMKFTVVNN